MIGVLLFAVKYNLDRLVAGWGFGRQWSLLQYLAPGGTVQTVSRDDMRFYATLVALALPFVAAGVVLTLRRLRAAGLPGWLVTVFFLPGVNLLFFVVLCLAPSRPLPGDPPLPSAGLLDRVIPDHPLGSAAVGVLLALVAALVTVLISVQTIRQYGWGLFVALPFAMGLLSVLVYGYHGHRDLAGCLGVSLLSVAVAGRALLVLAPEGIICLLMAAPLALSLAALGGAIGYRIQRYPEWRQASRNSCWPC